MESFKERHVTWLENFYDLSVSIVVYQISRNLTQDVSIHGVLSFIILFIPVWWSWIGVTFYSTRFETDDLIHRLFMLLQITASAFMAVSVPDGLGKNSEWFALSYALIRIILVIEYLRTRRHVPSANNLTTRYVIGFSISAVIWIISAIMPPQIRFILWMIGLTIDVGTPLIFTRNTTLHFTPHVQHLPERFGSFTIIVLGISILGVVNGIAPHNWTLYSILSSGLGLGIAFSLWWIYFDSVDGSEIKDLQKNKRINIYLIWLYIHFPLIIGFTAIGVSVEQVVLSNQYNVLSDSVRLLLSFSAFLCLFSLGIIQITSIMTGTLSIMDTTKLNRVKKYSAGIYSISTGLGVLIMGIFLNNPIFLLPVIFIGIVSAACIGQVILDVKRHPHHRFSKF